MHQVKAQEVLDKVRISEEMTRERLCQVARTALRTKVHSDLADKLTEVCVDAVLAIKEEGKPLDLHMVEIMDMQVSFKPVLLYEKDRKKWLKELTR